MEQRLRNGKLQILITVLYRMNLLYDQTL